MYYLLPSDIRSCRWDIARDFDSPASIIQFCHAVLPDSPGDSNPFFTEAFRELMIGVMISLNITQPGRWDLGDVVHILESRDFTAQVLNRTPASRSRLRFMNNERTWANIEATLETRLNDFRIMAAMWSRARGTFSLVDFVQSEGVLILGRDPRYAALLDPLNVLLFTQLFGQLLAQSDAPTGRTHLVIDELTVAAGEGKPLPGFKDICERGASRGVVVAVAFQSYADVKALYEDSGDAILGMLQHQVFLRAGDYPTAEFGAKHFGKTRKWTKGPPGDSENTSWQWLEVDVVPYEKFLELKPATPEDGISGYRLSPGRDDAGLFHLPGSWVAANLPKRSEDVKPYLERPVSHQYLEPLSFSDLKRLRLSLPEEEDEAKAASRRRPFRRAPIGGRPRFRRRPVQRMTSRGNCAASSVSAQNFDEDEDDAPSSLIPRRFALAFVVTLNQRGGRDETSRLFADGELSALREAAPGTRAAGRGVRPVAG